MQHCLEYANAPKFSTYKSRAKSKLIYFSLSIEEFNQMSKSSCSYCGVQGPNGIDRKNNSKGYTLDNCVPCCKHCNYVKGDLSQDDFNTWKNRFVLYQSKGLFKGLLVDWRNKSKRFKNEEDYSSADVVDSNVAELEALFTAKDSNERRQNGKTD